MKFSSHSLPQSTTRLKFGANCWSVRDRAIKFDNAYMLHLLFISTSSLLNFVLFSQLYEEKT